MAKWTSSSPSPKVSIREVFNFAIVKSVLSNKCSVHLRTLKMDFGKYFFSKKMSSSSISFNTRNSDVSLSTITFSQSFHGGKLPLQDFSFAWKITFTKSCQVGAPLINVTGIPYQHQKLKFQQCTKDKISKNVFHFISQLTINQEKRLQNIFWLMLPSFREMTRA